METCISYAVGGCASLHNFPLALASNYAHHAPMMQIATAEQVEEHARRAGKSLAGICRDAGIARSTFTRWKSGRTEPTLAVYKRILSAVGIETEQA